MNPSELEHTLETATTIARMAGAILREAYSRPRQVTYKGETNLVTETDVASEKAIVSALREHFPEHAVVAEEGSDVTTGGAYTWVVDPLDGTNNFAHGFPVFCVSIALLEGKNPLVGVIYDPLRDECFTAARGCGAFLNGAPLAVSGTETLRRGLIATGFPYERDRGKDFNAECVHEFLLRAQDVRRAGAAALDLAYVACGRLDGYWEHGLQMWDVAAGILLVLEAGGVVTGYDGKHSMDLIYHGTRLIASNGLIHHQMADTLHEVYAAASFL